MKRNEIGICIINADTEGTPEGFLTAFIASRCETRLTIKAPHYKGKRAGKDPPKFYAEDMESLKAEIARIPKRYECTQQPEVRAYFDLLLEICDNCTRILNRMNQSKSKDELKAVIIMHYANIGWDIDQIKGIAFDKYVPMSITGTDSDMIQFRYGNIMIRDFLRVTGFRSIKHAGTICFNAHKEDGQETYNIKLEDIPEKFEDYSETKKSYIRNDVAVMDESLNIILNRVENLTIETISDLPMTSTGFSRYRNQHNNDIIMINGEKADIGRQLTSWRWRYQKPYILYLIDAFKGGYCAPNPHTQYKILENVICYDVCSMYPDKMLFNRHITITEQSRMLRCSREIDEMIEHKLTLNEDEKMILDRYLDIIKYLHTFSEFGLPENRPDSENGIFPWTASVTLKINGIRYDDKNDICMMPFLSEYKAEYKAPGTACVNGKILKSPEVRIKLTSIDLILCFLSYDCKVINIDHLLTMGWKELLPVQKRSVLSGYKAKMKISETLKKDIDDTREYWINDCGFNFDHLKEMDPKEYKKFGKIYKQIVKAVPNGEYGKTVEKPLHPKAEIKINDEGIPEVFTESFPEMIERCKKYMKTVGGFYDEFGDPIEKEYDEEWTEEKPIPDFVKCNDFCAGSSVTMWARFHLFLMQYVLFKNGIETFYCDTDSIFTINCEIAKKCIDKFNEWKKTQWKWAVCGNNEVYNSEQLDGLGLFEDDEKNCRFFRTLGSKNYAYINKNNEIDITIAGLNTSKLEDIINDMIKSGTDPYIAIKHLYRPNLYVEPSACKKLIRTRETCQYHIINDKILWAGATLVPYGFAIITTDSKYHRNNMLRCEELQEKSQGYYLGQWNSKLYVSDKGFTENITEETAGYEAFKPLEEQHIFKGR